MDDFPARGGVARVIVSFPRFLPDHESICRDRSIQGTGRKAAPVGHDESPDMSESVSVEVAFPAGGWRRLAVRASEGGRIVASASVEHVGIGEVFVVAGQSNSANHGEANQTTQTGRGAAFDGARWTQLQQ
jgi:hypothetical protein